MDSFRIYKPEDIKPLVQTRVGETKLGECIGTYQQAHLSVDLLRSHPAKFVLLGIPEDIGVRGNAGIGGAHTAWPMALKAFLNLQQNAWLRGEELMLLGHFEVEAHVGASVNELRAAVAKLDEQVWPLLKLLAEAGKIPLIIGGGHNNAFPILKGMSLGLGQKMAVVNFDAHSDLRSSAEGRHSGNGFSNALEQGYLHRYFIYGLHQNYLSQAQYNSLQTQIAVELRYFEDILDENWPSLCLPPAFTNGYGIEIDLDCLSHQLASAATPSGFSLNYLRQQLRKIAAQGQYLHICEGAAQLADGRQDFLTGKTIAYLLSDFIKISIGR